MLLKKIEFDVEILTIDELSNEEKELVETAIDQTKYAYAKYSNFCVGAALRLADNKIVRGANQENASFPLGLCAERSAIFAAQSYYPEQAITCLAIAAKNQDGLLKSPITPCGACRQVMLEMEDRYQNNMAVLLYGTDKIYRLKRAKDLLPLCFVDADMH